MTPADTAPTRLTADEYFQLVDTGQLSPDDRVELLEGVVVSMAPQSLAHEGGITKISKILFDLIGDRATVRVQLSFLAGRGSVPEPDFAVVPGRPADYEHRRADEAHLIIEVSHSSLPTDRISKSRIYATASVAQYLIVNLPGDCVEVFEHPDPANALYRSRRTAHRGEHITLVAFPDLSLRVDDILPSSPHLPH